MSERIGYCHCGASALIWPKRYSGGLCLDHAPPPPLHPAVVLADLIAELRHTEPFCNCKCCQLLHRSLDRAEARLREANQ